MPKGRPPKPTTLAWLQGDPSKRRRYQVEPMPPPEAPPCPDYLDDIAKAEWQRTIKTLGDMGLLTVADQTSLVCYCEAWSRYRKATEQVAKFGTVILSPEKKFPMVSPYLTIQRHALKDVLAFADRFGLSPSARARLAVEADGKGDDLDQFLQRPKLA